MNSSEQTALLLQAAMSPGTAASGNSEPANLLLIVTELATGKPVANLTQQQIGVINHFSVPGQTAGFSRSGGP